MENRKLSDLKLKFKIWLENPEGTSILGDGKYQLLKAIDQEGSLMAAITKQNLDYRRTWGKLKRIEKLLGFALLEKTRGGKDGGKTVLTSEGKKLVRAFDSFHAKIDQEFRNSFPDFYRILD